MISVIQVVSPVRSTKWCPKFVLGLLHLEGGEGAEARIHRSHSHETVVALKIEHFFINKLTCKQ